MNTYYNLICERLNQKKKDYETRMESFKIMTENDLGKSRNYEANAIDALLPMAGIQETIHELEFLKMAYETMEQYH
jgi:hypothetical protein